MGLAVPATRLVLPHNRASDPTNQPSQT